MQNVLDFINNFLTHMAEIKEIPIVSLGLAVFAYLWGRYTNYKEHRKKGLSFSEASDTIAHIDARLKALQLTFNGKHIKKLNISQFALWNSGNGTIRNGVDIPKERPLSVKCQGSTEIMSAKILAESEPASHFQLSFDSKQATLDFEFLEENDGVIVQILHTGEVYVDVKVIDGNKNINEVSHSMFKKGQSTIWFLITMIVIGSMTFILTSIPIIMQILSFVFADITAPFGSLQDDFFKLLAAVCYSIFWIIFWIIQLRTHLRLHIPKALRHYEKFALEEESSG